MSPCDTSKSFTIAELPPWHMCIIGSTKEEADRASANQVDAARLIELERKVVVVFLQFRDLEPPSERVH